jgi:hypothetical protein
MAAFRTGGLVDLLVPIGLGTAAFVAVTSGVMLSPSNTSWLMQGDLAQSYLGWAYFRRAPWDWPLGTNPGYGLDFHSSVYYSDSIPLLAIGFKLMADLLPEPFQYFGGWVLLCLILQGVLSWKLVGLVSGSPWIRAPATVLFVLSPPMLNRIYGHMALVGHWMILAGIYLCLRHSRPGDSWRWAVLMAAAVGVHAYLAAGVGALWMSDLIGRHLELRRAGSAGNLPLLAEGLAVTTLVALVAWQCGFFMVPSHGMGATGFGYYKMNLLAPLDSRGWSELLPALGGARGEREGFNYPGLGGLLLIASAALAIATRRFSPRFGTRGRMLLLLVAVLTLAALTPNVGIGGHQFSLPLPDRVSALLARSPIQSTGRLFWVVYYLSLWSALLVLGKALPARPLLALVMLAAVIQLFDLRPGLRKLREHNVTGATMAGAAPLVGPFWEAAADRYTVVRRLPARVSGEGWERIAWYAARHGMGTDAVKLARVDWRSLSGSERLHRERLLLGRPDPNALYVLSDEYAHLARAGLSNPADVLVRADGYNVLAPSWGRALPLGALVLEPSASRFQLPFSTDFASEDGGRLLLGDGWHTNEKGPVRAGEDEATLFVPTGAPSQGVQVTLLLTRSAWYGAPARVQVYAAGNRVADTALGEHSAHRLSFRLPPTSPGHHFRRLVLRFGSSRGLPAEREPPIELEQLEARAAAESPHGPSPR